jgi:hypothetical protein
MILLLAEVDRFCSLSFSALLPFGAAPGDGEGRRCILSPSLFRGFGFGFGFGLVWLRGWLAGLEFAIGGMGIIPEAIRRSLCARWVLHRHLFVRGLDLARLALGGHDAGSALLFPFVDRAHSTSSHPHTLNK